MLSIFMLFIVKKGHRLSAFIIALPTFANTFGYIFGTPAQNVRYLYSSFSCFIILLVFTFMVNGIQKAKAANNAVSEKG
jgi:heme/copper-type cytochrome/quinol oxidase subunit 1